MGLEIGGAQLPVLVRGQQAFAQTLELLAGGDLQVDLAQQNAGALQLVLEGGNLLQARADQLGADKALVGAAIEDTDAAQRRQAALVTGEEMFLTLGGAG